MARIRSTHPTQWTDEDFVEISPFGRLLVLGVRNEADDQGVFEWKPTTLKMRILPADNVDIETLLEEGVSARQFVRFEVGDKSYGAIRNFRKYQKPKKPNAIHPLPNQLRNYVGLTGESTEPNPVKSIPNSEPDEELPPDKKNLVPNSISDKEGSVPHQSPTSSEIAIQMEDGGGKMEEVDTTESDINIINSIGESAADPPSERDDDVSSLLDIPERQDQTARRFIRIFDRVRSEVFGESQARAWPAQSDYEIAKLWHGLPVTEGVDRWERAEMIFRHHLGKKHAAGDQPIGGLNYFKNFMPDDLRKPVASIPDAGDAGGGLPSQNHPYAQIANALTRSQEFEAAKEITNLAKTDGVEAANRRAAELARQHNIEAETMA